LFVSENLNLVGDRPEAACVDVPDVVGGVLRAIGVQADQVNRALRPIDAEIVRERDTASATETN
jgi:hypothetical protein